MKKIIYVLGFVVLMCMEACSGEDDLTPSSLDNNWWVNVDNLDDPLDPVSYTHLDVYKRQI